jgi:hypothetical protein
MICAVVAPATSAEVTNPCRRLWAEICSTSLGDEPASRSEKPLDDVGHDRRPSIGTSRNSPRRTKRL